MLRVAAKPLASLAVSALFITFFSPTTSPLNPRYGGDAALFRVIGTSMAEGQQLYLDVWDHKGPVFFLYQSLAQEIAPGRAGIFFCQIALLAATLLCFDAIAARFGNWVLRTTVTIGVLAYSSQVFDGGNLTEEFSQPFVALSLMILTRDWGNGAKPLISSRTPAWMFALAGAAFALVVFTRLNNALPIFAAFLAYFLVALFGKDPFLRRLAASLAGFSTVTAVILLGFWAAGSLAEMLDASFLFNFRYASEKGGAEAYLALARSGYFRLALIAIGVCVVGGLTNYRQHRTGHFLVLAISLAGATTAAVFASANGYPHYLQSAIPALAIGAILLLAPLNLQALLVALVAVCFTACNAFLYASAQSDALTRGLNDPAFIEATNSVLAEVPEAERASIYPWAVPSEYYLIAGTTPIQRYFTHQDWWGAADPSVLDEALSFVEAERPRWILTTATGPEEMRLINILNNEYVLATENNELRLYERA